MFQRIQTLYLGLAIVALSCMFLFDICAYTLENENGSLAFNVSVSGVETKIDGSSEGLEHYGDVIDILLEERGLDRVFTLGKFALFFAIFLLLFIMLRYKKRSLQLKLGRVCFLLFLAVFVGLFFAIDMGQGVLVDQLSGRGIENIGEAFKKSYGVALFLPVVAAAFTFLANMHIKKDINLLKSVDRIR